MNFLKRRIAANVEIAIAPDGAVQEVVQEVDSGMPSLGRNRWSTTFLVVGSALLGATAIAFWNRRTIAGMRAQMEAGNNRAPATRPADEEIF